MCFRPAGVELGEDAIPTKIECPSCGAENMNTRKTCHACGAELPKKAPAAAPAFPDAFGGAPNAPQAPGTPPPASPFPDAFGNAK